MIMTMVMIMLETIDGCGSGSDHDSIDADDDDDGGDGDDDDDDGGDGDDDDDYMVENVPKQLRLRIASSSFALHACVLSHKDEVAMRGRGHRFTPCMPSISIQVVMNPYAIRV
jgi:hypothetical protein